MNKKKVKMNQKQLAILANKIKVDVKKDFGFSFYGYLTPHEILWLSNNGAKFSNTYIIERMDSYRKVGDGTPNHVYFDFKNFNRMLAEYVNWSV